MLRVSLLLVTCISCCQGLLRSDAAGQFVLVPSSIMQWRSHTHTLESVDILYDDHSKYRLDFEFRRTWCAIVTKDADEHAKGANIPWKRKMFEMQTQGTRFLTSHRLNGLQVDAADGSATLLAPIEFGHEMATDGEVGKLQYVFRVKSDEDWLKAGSYTFIFNNPAGGEVSEEQRKKFYKQKAAYEKEKAKDYKEMKRNHALEEYQEKWKGLSEQADMDAMINAAFPRFWYGETLHEYTGDFSSGRIPHKLGRKMCADFTQPHDFVFPVDAAEGDVTITITHKVTYTVRMCQVDAKIETAEGTRWVCKYTAGFWTDTGKVVGKPQLNREEIRQALEKEGNKRADQVAAQIEQENQDRMRKELEAMMDVAQKQAQQASIRIEQEALLEQELNQAEQEVDWADRFADDGSLLPDTQSCLQEERSSADSDQKFDFH